MITQKGYYNEDINCYNRVVIDKNNKIRFKVFANIIIEVDTAYLSNKTLVSDTIHELFNFILNRPTPITPQLFCLHLWDLGYSLQDTLNNLNDIKLWITAISKGYPTLLMVDPKYDNEEVISNIYETYSYFHKEYKSFYEKVSNMENGNILYELLITTRNKEDLDKVIPELSLENDVLDMIDILDYYS